MTEKEIKLNKGQRLSDIMDEIQPNTILYKTVCGIGATTLELETGFKDANLKAAVEAKKTFNLERSAGVVAAVHNKFKEGQWYSIADINTGLQEIYRTFKIPYNKRGISGNICIYYEAVKTERGRKKGYLLKSKLATT